MRWHLYGRLRRVGSWIKMQITIKTPQGETIGRMVQEVTSRCGVVYHYLHGQVVVFCG